MKYLNQYYLSDIIFEITKSECVDPHLTNKEDLNMCKVRQLLRQLQTGPRKGKHKWSELAWLERKEKQERGKDKQRGRCDKHHHSNLRSSRLKRRCTRNLKSRFQSSWEATRTWHPGVVEQAGMTPLIWLPATHISHLRLLGKQEPTLCPEEDQVCKATTSPVDQ